VRKTWLIAEYLRRHAWWRLNRSDPRDEGRNARCAVALLDAAAYTVHLPDDAPVVGRLMALGCFTADDFALPAPAERVVRFWHFDQVEGGPDDLLAAILAQSEPHKVPAPRSPGRRGRSR
jgi:hypothetical protein